jgi:O-antigen/teichoic acid export membrane protein
MPRRLDVTVMRRMARYMQASDNAHTVSSISLARDGTLLFGLKIVGITLGLAMQVVLARLLGKQSFGLFATAFNAAMLLSLLGSIGIPFAAYRFLPAYLSKGEIGLASGFIRMSWLSTLAGGAAGAVILLAFAVHLASQGNADDAEICALAALVVPFLVAAQTASLLLQALKRPLHADVPFQILRPIIVIVCVLAVASFSAVHLNEIVSMLIVVVASAIALSVLVGSLRRAIPVATQPSCNRMEARIWLKSGFVMLLLVGGAALTERLDVMLIAGLANAADAGVYSVVARVAQVLSLASAAVAARAAPLLAERLAQGDIMGVQWIAVATSLTAVGLAAGTGLAVLSVSGFLLDLFGPGFEAGQPALLILLGGHTILATAAAAAPLLIVSGKEWKVAAVFALSVAVNVILNTVLVPRFGMQGAAAATTTAMTLSAVGTISLVRLELGRLGATALKGAT